MLPKPDARTLSRYLLSVSETISKTINLGLDGGDAAARLRECATVVARVAQQIEQPAVAGWTLAEETQALAAAEAAFAAQEEARLQAGLGPASPSLRSIDARAVERYLQAHTLGGAQTRVSEARLLAGGRCKLTALVTQEGAAALPETFILRQDWDGGATDTLVAAEYDLLAAVVAGGVKAPRPLLVEPEASIVGPSFILVERKPGALAGSLFTPPRSPELFLQFAEQLGRLHSLPPATFGDPDAELAGRRDRLVSDLALFRQQHETVGIASRIIDAALDWLGANLDDAGEVVRLTHNDLGFHNTLVEGDNLTALLDWELARLGHPAEDLGYVRPFTEQVLPWADFTARYEESGGWAIEERSLRFYTIWSAVRLYGLICLAREAIARDLVNDIEITFACADNLMLLLQHLSGNLQKALAEPG